MKFTGQNFELIESFALIALSLFGYWAGGKIAFHPKLQKIRTCTLAWTGLPRLFLQICIGIVVALLLTIVSIIIPAAGNIMVCIWMFIMPAIISALFSDFDNPSFFK